MQIGCNIIFPRAKLITIIIIILIIIIIIGEDFYLSRDLDRSHATAKRAEKPVEDCDKLRFGQNVPGLIYYTFSLH